MGIILMATKEKWVTVNGKHMLVDDVKKSVRSTATGGSTKSGRGSKGRGTEKKQLAKIDKIDNLKTSKKK